ncbi:MAG: hypothetical protein IJ024_01225 [Lachnospiraceae bacterium]|nr:hypothetical protein [Lachnospiraceae bacterium]
MGLVKLCIHKTTKTPFYAETTGIHLYSIEELAYYLYENIYLIDERLVEERLYSWIEKELELPLLAEKLRSGRNTGNHIYNQVMTILQASEYYSEEELNTLSEKIKTISGLQTQERMKYKADEMAQNENYWAAITEYERILSIRQSSKLAVSFYAGVWNNLAGCYARLFLFEKAAGCFESAYQFEKISEYKEKAYYARKLAAFGKKETEELIERQISKEFLDKATQTLKNLEEQSLKECEEMLPQEFLKKREKTYCRISSV